MPDELEKAAERLQNYSNTLQNTKNAINKTKGKIEALLNQLKEYKINSIEEAAALRTKLETELTKEKKILISKLEELRKKYELHGIN